jgi:hypothetical protein
MLINHNWRKFKKSPKGNNSQIIIVPENRQRWEPAVFTSKPKTSTEDHPIRESNTRLCTRILKGLDRDRWTVDLGTWSIYHSNGKNHVSRH